MAEKTGQILFCRKNHIDLDRPNPVITITDSVADNTGQDSVVFLRNRNNISGWLTTGSDDTANTEILVELGDYLDVDFIELIKHNFKNYLVEYRDVSMVWHEYVNIVDNAEATNIHDKLIAVNTNAIRITIYDTIIADADKEMRQLIITEKAFRFEGWPVIKKPQHSKNRKNNRVLSGKVRSVTTRGAFSTTLEIKLSGSENDLDMHEKIYDQAEGLLLLISGGDEDQFRTKRKGYKNEDIVLVKAVDEYTNPYDKGVYKIGMKIKMKLEESVD